jgi:hypothetical protein
MAMVSDAPLPAMFLRWPRAKPKSIQQSMHQTTIILYISVYAILLDRKHELNASL